MSGFSLNARLRLTLTEGYRISGWRGICSFDGIIAPDGATLFGCELTLNDRDRWLPGQEVVASLRFWAPRDYVGELAPGLAIQLFEGGDEVASGVIMNVHEEDTGQ